MKIFYQGINITDSVNIRSCTVKDRTGKTDSIDITFGNAVSWYNWQPQEDDVISVENDGYFSGNMYVNTIVPEDGNFRIIASSLPCNARNKQNRSYFNTTIEGIIKSCAFETGMDYQIYGIEKTIHIPYIERNNEGCAAFLQRFLTLEGATLKCINGRFVAIGIEYIQNKTAANTINLNHRQSGVIHQKSGTKIKGLTIKSVYGEGVAFDSAVEDTHSSVVLNQIPVLDDITAYRWARNKLLDFNRKKETVSFNSIQFNPKFTSMIRVDINSDTETSGEWIVDEVTHDLIDNTTSFSMYRCLTTIQ